MPGSTPNNGGAGGSGAVTYSNNITSNIEKLNGENYVNWKFAMRMALILEGLRDCVDVAENVQIEAARDTCALARICLSIEPSLYQYVRDATSACDAWKRLADTFEGKGLYRKVLLLRQLHRIENGQFPSMPNYINGVMKLVHQLEDIGKKIDDGEVAEIMLSGLTQEFDILVTSLETACLTSELTSELVRTRLLQEDDRRHDHMSRNGDGPAAYSVSNKMRSIVCSFCKRTGHVYKRCFKRKREESKRKTENHTMYASAYSVTTSSDEFIVDSGASSHMCAEELVEDLQKKKWVISVANGQKLNCDYIGKVSLSPEITLDSVLFVPDLSSNLISVSTMAEKGYVVVFKKDGCDIYTNDCKIIGNKVLFARKVNGLYKCKLQGQPIPNVKPSMPLQSMQRTVRANAATCVPASTWHKRLGHRNPKGMSILGGGKQCMGVVFQKEDGTRSCVSCLTGKMHMAPFPRAGRRAACQLELIHADVCGPTQVSSWGGARFLLTFTDDYSRKTFGYLMKNKSEFQMWRYHRLHGRRCLNTTTLVMRMCPLVRRLLCQNLHVKEEH